MIWQDCKVGAELEQTPEDEWFLPSYSPTGLDKASNTDQSGLGKGVGPGKHLPGFPSIENRTSQPIDEWRLEGSDDGLPMLLPDHHL